MSKVISSNLGYPRIGEKREWKKTLEQFWAGKIEKDSFLEQMEEIRVNHLKKQLDQGIDLVPVGDFSLYDHVLDTAVMFGLVPERFHYRGGKVSLETYFEMARGSKDAVALEMTKWFNTNYHYLVPELDGNIPQLVENRPLHFFREAKEKLGIEGKPVILGPFTFVKLSKGYETGDYKTLVAQFVPLYAEVLRELEEEGVEWVQMDEPILCTSIGDEEMDQFKEVYQTLKESCPGLKIILQTYYDSLERYQRVLALPVDGIGIDFVHDRGENLAALKKFGFPKDKFLAAGILDGRNIWRSNLADTQSLLSSIAGDVPGDRLIIQPSCSLLHVPVTVQNEETINTPLIDALSFADEKLHEITILTKGIREGAETIEDDISESETAIRNLNESTLRNNRKVQEEVEELHPNNVGRKDPFHIRKQEQAKYFSLPFLPTTTIGSFPQTQEVRRQRLKWRKGDLSDGEYQQYIQAEIRRWIEIQEQIGLDVFVHGEFERTDMVEFFGEKLEGFQFTKYGWVQSYGSRCVKPPLIYGDVKFKEPMTVRETVYAQSLTDKPVKGMLTGPITILNWSFVRNDVSRYEVANQIALSLQKEIEELEANGIRMIQVDEPALREGLPLKSENWEEYLNAAVYAFKLATSSVQNQTQVHTHMCYSDFEDIIDAINDLDADVISIETSRSHGELIHVFEDNTYDKGIGLGVYDIHSPRVPKREELIRNIHRAIEVLDPDLFWVNPDCGLKTRGIDETVSALKTMVEAAEQVREEMLMKKEG
ncbi:5-methyltetrahydropteroyltriglutamate--homocysteine S-methyltransferase [Rossellomorea aquimaris]|uniref:5-methyltetrahydropteroyltriglutamate-- homocysteine S-methyltransferase n=1 Tax=Rossellomorea aquimaris TaxID=189382 RepID=UPI0011E95E94|nr:5-methyltetrahydropteroyltriglutamate--homocysteine S-methyltransferase [Rossellomorea aquimaris]TYS86382.1 5-methyltetrahydropteroyltriglutamate--homocysteine S-methyltransferase [Rossellomorea aquimaris]